MHENKNKRPQDLKNEQAYPTGRLCCQGACRGRRGGAGRPGGGADGADGAGGAFPCAWRGCGALHEDAGGFCALHRRLRLLPGLAAWLLRAWAMAELCLLFFTQAALEMESRMLLLLVLLSLCPFFCISVAGATGVPWAAGGSVGEMVGVGWEPGGCDMSGRSLG